MLPKLSTSPTFLLRNLNIRVEKTPYVNVTSNAGALTLDSATLAAYTSAVLRAPLGSKRLAGANALLNIFSPYSVVFNIYQNGNQIIHTLYSGTLSVTNISNVVSLNFGIPISSSMTSGSLSSGTWTFHITGGPSGLNNISGTVGATGSGANITLDFDPVAGMGFISAISFIVPKAVDGIFT